MTPATTHVRLSLMTLLAVVCIVSLSCFESYEPGGENDTSRTTYYARSQPTPSSSYSGRATQFPRAGQTARPIHWQLAELHVKYGGEGTIPQGRETALSTRIKNLMGSIAEACSGTEFEVASLTLAANAVLVIFESSFSLVEFMEFFLDLALASTEDCEEVTYAALAAIERFEDPLGRYK